MITSEQLLNEMTRYGFDLIMAMEICAEDPELYREVLETGLEEGERVLPILRECLERENLERYHVEVHSLKNSARALGAERLSDLARSEEEAVKLGVCKINAGGSQSLLDEYERVLGILRLVLSQ